MQPRPAAPWRRPRGWIRERWSLLGLGFGHSLKEGFPAYLLDLSRRQSPSLDESGRDGFDEEPIHRRGDERLGFLDLGVKILLNHLGRAVEIVSQFARGNRSRVEGDKGTEHIGPRTYVLDASVDPTEARKGVSGSASGVILV